MFCPKILYHILLSFVNQRQQPHACKTLHLMHKNIVFLSTTDDLRRECQTNFKCTMDYQVINMSQESSKLPKLLNPYKAPIVH